MTAPPQSYPPQQYAAPPQPAQRGPVSPRWTAGLLATFAFLIAAGATIWGTFETIQSYRHTYAEPVNGAREYRYSMTWWTLDETGPSAALPRSFFPPYGVLPAVAGGLLVLAAILALTAFAGRRAGLVTGVRVATAAGVGLLAGLAAIRLLDALQTLDQVNGENLDPGESTDFHIGLGIYLPGGAAVLGIVGLAITLHRGRTARVEPDTPRMGIPMPYQPQQYQPYQQPYVQQPASAPFPAPVSQPISQPIPAQQPIPQAEPAPPAPAPPAPDASAPPEEQK